jgi:hypothetical protein
MFNYSAVKSATLPAPAYAPNNVRLLNFSKPVYPSVHASAHAHAPAPKSWFTKKFIPVVKQVGSIAGKVATVASVL